MTKTCLDWTGILEKCAPSQGNQEPAHNFSKEAPPGFQTPLIPRLGCFGQGARCTTVCSDPGTILCI